LITGGIAHDFNNMLAIVLGNAELAMSKLPEDSRAQPMLKEIVAASIGATDFCNQMLAYAGRGALSTEVLEFNALVAEIVGLLHVALSKKTLLQFDLAETPLGVLADRSQLSQVIMNLVTNASESLGNSEGSIVISTAPWTLRQGDADANRWGTALPPGDYVLLTVKDTGSGMSVKTRDKIFDPFFTTKATGRGLGLSAVQGIVLGHKGAITLESKPGEGTTFTVVLPCVALPEDVTPESPRAVDVPQGTTILVVDDEPNVQRILTDILEDAGYAVMGARDGLEAVDVYRKNHQDIDLVMLDLSMPKLDGEEVFRELQRIRSEVRGPVVRETAGAV
jgi:signal transduction histidine kinase